MALFYAWAPDDERSSEVDPEGGAPETTAFEAWNDYDPSMRFITAFPITAAHGTASSTVAYYELEPGRHSGLHADDAEETIYVADGEGEIFISGRQERLEAGGFQFVPSGVQHDVYAYGDRPLRLLSFFPSARVESTFTEMLLPFGSYTVSSDQPAAIPQVQEISYEELPPELQELGGGGMFGPGWDEPTEEEAPDEPATDEERAE
jgi:quercetin dioxygenase-like cupin family protein